MKDIRIHKTGLAALLAAVVFAITPSTLLAGGGSPPGPLNGGGNRGGTEDVESVPRRSTGFVLLVDGAALTQVIGSIRGESGVDVALAADGRFVITLSGRHVVEIDKRLVVGGHVRFTYQGAPEDARVIQTRRSIYLMQR